MKQSTVMRLGFLVLGVVAVLGWRLVDMEETGQTSSSNESGPSAQGGNGRLSFHGKGRQRFTKTTSSLSGTRSGHPACICTSTLMISWS